MKKKRYSFPTTILELFFKMFHFSFAFFEISWLIKVITILLQESFTSLSNCNMLCLGCVIFWCDFIIPQKPSVQY